MIPNGNPERNIKLSVVEAEGRMTEPEKSNDLRQTLQPFYDRASQAEERLSRLEAALANKKDAGNGELLKTISELQSKLEVANTELVSERKKAEKLAVENEKLNYRVKHLIRALEAADLNSKTA